MLILMDLQENIPLAPHTTLKVGGTARYFVEGRTIAEIRKATEYANSRNLPLFILGGGSNVVVSDSGWQGLVVKIAVGGIDERQESDLMIFEVGAGESWDKFVLRTVDRKCGGVECMSGIPGSVGGTPVQNVGAYGQEAAETIASVQVLDLRDGQIRELCKEACAFSYRTSIFNTTERGRFIIVRVDFALRPGGPSHIEYADLKKYFAGWSSSPSLAQTREAVRQIRARKGMLITRGDEDSRSAGSFFKNPFVTPEQFADLTQRATARTLQIPSYPALEAQRKISAAWLVE